MDDSFFMCLYDLVRQQKTSRDILADLTSHIITLYTVDGRILIGIFLFYFLIITFDQTQDLFIRRIGFAHKRPPVTVCDIISGYAKRTQIHDLILYQILNFLYI